MALFTPIPVHKGKIPNSKTWNKVKHLSLNQELAIAKFFVQHANFNSTDEVRLYVHTDGSVEPEFEPFGKPLKYPVEAEI